MEYFGIYLSDLKNELVHPKGGHNSRILDVILTNILIEVSSHNISLLLQSYIVFTVDLVTLTLMNVLVYCTNRKIRYIRQEMLCTTKY